MPEPLDKKKWESARKAADKIYLKPSAYKSGYIVKKYKELGGTFKGEKKKSTGLPRWFAEKWVNQHGHVGYKHKNDVYRPSKRITKKTPTTWTELSKKQIEKAKRTKSAGKRVKKFNV
jgi:hypothetical protein